ncbi:calcium-binding protein [Roseomonas sp. GCM10028921]
MNEYFYRLDFLKDWFGRDNDNVVVNLSEAALIQRDLGTGRDVVRVSADQPGQVRLTFTSAEVGNGSANDSNTMANQDGGLAVRLQAEDGSDSLAGPVSRFDDEGITFEAAKRGLTFDVRDLVVGTQRGDQFDVVRLGTSKGDWIDESGAHRSYYINAGMGDDIVVGGRAEDFLVGGTGNDTLSGGRGDDSLLGGAGDDKAILNISRDGADTADLGAGDDVVRVSADQDGQVRLTFTSAEVGNGGANDASTMANQDGGLAVRLQAEDGSGNVTGQVSRFDDEGITFEAAKWGLTFDVRDLVAGTQRGDQFDVVRLGTSVADILSASSETESYYINAGMGDDVITGGKAGDFLVGGPGNDTLSGDGGSDSLLGGAGADTFVLNTNPGAWGNHESVLDFSTADDTIQLDSEVFVGLPDGQLMEEAFALSTAAAEDDDRVIYDPGTGELSFDADGGRRDDVLVFATLTTKPAGLFASDFFIA